MVALFTTEAVKHIVDFRGACQKNTICFLADKGSVSPKTGLRLRDISSQLDIPSEQLIKILQKLQEKNIIDSKEVRGYTKWYLLNGVENGADINRE